MGDEPMAVHPDLHGVKLLIRVAKDADELLRLMEPARTGRGQLVEQLIREEWYRRVEMPMRRETLAAQTAEKP
jgi:hypothetical protein